MSRIHLPVWSRQLLAASLALLPAGCAGESPDRAPLEGFNVVLITVDTLGAKHLATGEDSFTPNLDGLAAQGKRFQRALTTAPWTQPAVASLFTSRMPARHGVQRLMDSLPTDALTLAERFADAGYATGAVVSHFLIDGERGFDQGFASFDTSAISDAGGLTAKRVTTRAVRLLEQQEGPFFLFVHYFDPHSLYNHHPEFDRTSSYGGPMRPAMGVWEVRDRRAELSREDVEYLVGLYHEEIAYTDHHIGRLLARLDELGLAERTLVVFTADHGEEFMEHGWIGHTRTLHDELVHVPLVFRLPGRIDPGGVSTPVSILDVAPTVLELVLGEHDPSAEGVSLAETLLEGAEPPVRTLFVEVSFDSDVGEPQRAIQKRAFKTALVAGDLKLIHDLDADTWQLFDRSGDPRETRDLWGEDAARDGQLRELLLEWESERQAAGVHRSSGRDADAARLKELEQLGYVR